VEHNEEMILDVGAIFVSTSYA